MVYTMRHKGIPKGNEKISFYIYGQKYLGTVYAEPGKNVLDIDASLENNLSIENTLVKENEIVKELSRLQEEVFNLRARRGDAFQVAKDTVASSVYQKLMYSKRGRYKTFVCRCCWPL